MQVHLGNADAIEMVEQDGQAVWQTAPGERVTTFVIDTDMPTMEKFNVVIMGLRQMMNPTAKPWWVECDDDALRSMLADHFALGDATRPPAWGDGTTTLKGS